jgi:hypothetical protein
MPHLASIVAAHPGAYQTPGTGHHHHKDVKNEDRSGDMYENKG